MSDVKNNTKTQSFNFKFFGLTLFCLVVALSFVSLALPVIVPSKMVSLYKFSGLNRASVAAQETVYRHSGKAQDLYNLVVLCDELGEEELLLRYSKELLEREDFEEFATAFESYAQKHTDKDKLYLVASLKSYLVGIRIEYIYRQSPEKAFLEAVKCFEEDDLNVFYFSKYIACILLDNSLSNEQKNIALRETATSHVTADKNTIVKLLQERYNKFMNAEGERSLLELELLAQTKRIEVTLLETVKDNFPGEYQIAVQELESILEQVKNKLQ